MGKVTKVLLPVFLITLLFGSIVTIKYYLDVNEKSFVVEDNEKNNSKNINIEKYIEKIFSDINENISNSKICFKSYFDKLKLDINNKINDLNNKNTNSEEESSKSNNKKDNTSTKSTKTSENSGTTTKKSSTSGKSSSSSSDMVSCKVTSKISNLYGKTKTYKKSQLGGLTCDQYVNGTSEQRKKINCATAEICVQMGEKETDKNQQIIKQARNFRLNSQEIPTNLYGKYATGYSWGGVISNAGIPLGYHIKYTGYCTISNNNVICG